MQKVITKELDLNGHKLKLETGKLALQADAAVVASLGDTVVLATVATKVQKEDIGYFPLSVEYVEKHYASGKITPQKFIKREGRPSEKSVLSGRVIDRSIRPFFPKDFRNEVQVIVTVLSYDGVNDPVILGLIGASAALSISSIPWMGPLGVARIGEKDGQLVVNPDLADIESLNMELVVSASKDKIAMVEAQGKQIKDEVVFEAILKAHSESQPIIDLINEFTKEAGKEKQEITSVAEEVDENILKEAKELARERITKELGDPKVTWHDSLGQAIKDELIEKYAESLTPIQIASIFEKQAKETMNDIILNQKRRVDGRGMEDVRELYIETGLLPRAHGSALFQRGESQVLSIATIGPLSLSQTLEGMEGEGSKHFMHYYNMSINPFSSGEIKRISSPNRRDIGHGNLGEKSLVGVLPSVEDFPYAIRVVSEILGANASTSQAAICGSSLALLEAGVPIEPVAGIALGLITDHSDESKFQVITDMQAVEDFFGEMDFKVAGTKNGITGIQMDTKLTGISFDIVKEALRQGKAAREFILSKMAPYYPKDIKISKYAPKIETTHIDPSEIGLLIGSGGKTINGIIADTGAQIDIEDDGTVMVSSNDDEAIKKALDRIEGMFKKIAVGEIYEGKVVKIAPFGAFIELVPGKDGLVHVSKMAPFRVEKPEDIVTEGQTVKVHVTDVDNQGKVGLSMVFGESGEAIAPEPRRDSGGFDKSKRRNFGRRDRR